ncbi:hypothetical protein [Granulicella sp. dw_53]|uniref:hypothetical protein n=1 Tax=Granulicella sp. dw_53 TaxID=2719792 RepID=UPI001BD5E208|nr:hypothetical protein [Granulicella sp. dw_53]
MLQPYRNEFNLRFTDEGYKALRRDLSRKTGVEIPFRVCETPCFFAREVIDKLAAIGVELTNQLLDSPAYLKVSRDAIPDTYRVSGWSDHPHFMTVDFGFVKKADGSLEPKLVELQAFPSIFGYQSLLSQQYIETFGLSENLEWLLGKRTKASYWRLLGEVILGGHDPENVVLTEVEPDGQKTLPDFKVYEDKLGIATVDITKLRKEGERLFYQKGGRWIPIHRIFNRAIADEMERKGTRLAFDLRDDLDVEWAGHPNWYFQISKLSLPYLNHPSVPKAVFLDEWFAGNSDLPEERERVLLKPLYSFAGKGIKFAPTDAELAAIPVGERRLYLMQERVSFEPVIQTPEGLTQAEVRVLYVWPDGGTMEPTIGLVRLGRGMMMGVDHNRDQGWVGGSAALFPRSLA